MQKHSGIKRPRDFNQFAKVIIDISTGEIEDWPTSEPEKNPAAVALGRLGGRKGGKARAASLSLVKRSRMARAAARARWRKKT